jgi:acetyl-CoA carboxylase biotin carboxylase subunit
VSRRLCPFKKVLIANRGEIAVRVARTLRDMGISPIAVYSDADRNAPHVRHCDAAYRVGPAPAQESYLDEGAILAAAKQAGADAIHPGYGFLSENAGFAEAVAAAGIIFIGPPPAAMRTMGSKTAAREAMAATDVPCVPGSGALLDDASALQAAEQMGYPVMLKASAGGGGKGMRLVAGPAALPGALRAARSEAQGAFSDATVYMEKAILNPRHVEIQIFSAADGTTHGVGERECSMQRRHQKVIEETPCVALDPPLRARMVAVACQAAQAVNYRGAGTVEFLLDGDGNFYFLEMNTRLQVEHPVTELCFGVDLVEAQVCTAAGQSLPWPTLPLVPRGHAIEARLYAEDPDQAFMPSPGQIAGLQFPQGPGIRVDSGVAAGFEVSRYYDPMIAKISVWAPDRPAALARMARALSETAVHGITTNKAFLAELIACADFVKGDYHTGTLAAHMAAPKVQPAEHVALSACVAAVVQTYLKDSRAARQVVARESREATGWRAVSWRGRGS